jgi:uncharacterized protein YgfB (UPF0149 family)
MTPHDELRSLIERLGEHAELHDSMAQYDREQAQWGDDLRKAARLLLARIAELENADFYLALKLANDDLRVRAEKAEAEVERLTRIAI